MLELESPLLQLTSKRLNSLRLNLTPLQYWNKSQQVCNGESFDKVKSTRPSESSTVIDCEATEIIGNKINTLLMPN